MPLTAKGNEILSAMQKEYGAEKGESVFYASRNAGKITGVDADAKPRADMSDADWAELKRTLTKFFAEEAKEPEHRGDADDYEIKKQGDDFFIFKNGSRYNGRLESREAAEKVLARLTSRKDSANWANRLDAACAAVEGLTRRMGAVDCVEMDSDLQPGIPGEFVQFMEGKFGKDWVVGRATENMKARYETVISRGEYEKAIKEFNKQTGRRHY